MREMKDSGVAWIGEIPEEWVCCKQKYAMKLINGRAYSDSEFEKDGKYKILRVGNLFSNPVWYTSNLELPENKYCSSGDLLYSWSMSYAPVFWYGEKVIYHYHIWKVNLNDKIQKKFAYYYLVALTDALKAEIHETTMGFITMGVMNNSYIAIPNIAEQQTIATYLDQKCTQIDALITNQQKQIERLKAYKQSLITETVTKGLNPDVPMKDSGVEWIGEIPKDSKVTRAGHIYSIVLGKMLSPSPKQNSDTLEYYLCAANVHFTGISYEPLKQMWFSEIEKQLYAVQCGDLLVVEGGAGAGGAAIVEESLNNYYIQNSIMIARPKGDVSNKWLYYSLYSIVKHNYIDFVCNKATIPHFTKDKLSKVPIIIVKKEKETEIINYLDQKCTQIDNLIAIKQQKIEKLQQYKKSLIYEYVTGKKEI